MRTRYLIVYALVIATGLFLHLRPISEIALERPLAEFPGAVSGWRVAEDKAFSDSILKVLRPTDYLSRRYVNGTGEGVDLYIGYYDGGPESGGVHSPRHCLPGSGWALDFHEEKTVTMHGEDVRLVNAVYSKGAARHYLAYWFQVHGNTINNEYWLKAAEVINSAFRNRRDSAFVRISIAISESGREGERLVGRFVEDFYPVIRTFLSS